MLLLQRASQLGQQRSQVISARAIHPPAPEKVIGGSLQQGPIPSRQQHLSGTRMGSKLQHHQHSNMA